VRVGFVCVLGFVFGFVGVSGSVCAWLIALSMLLKATFVCGVFRQLLVLFGGDVCVINFQKKVVNCALCLLLLVMDKLVCVVVVVNLPIVPSPSPSGWLSTVSINVLQFFFALV